MEEVFPQQWVSKSGDICDDKGVYTRTFMLWCKKLEMVTDAGYQTAFKLLEERCASAEAEGKPYFPPSYSGFLGLTRVKAAHRQYRALELPCSVAERNKRGKEGTSKLFDLMRGITAMSESEANDIIEKAKESGLKELFNGRD